MMMQQRRAGATTAKDKDRNVPIVFLSSSSSSSSSSDDGGEEERVMQKRGEKEASTKEKKNQVGIEEEEEEEKKKKKKKERSTEGDEEEAPKKKNKKKIKADDKDKKMDSSCRFPMSRVWRLVRSEGGAATNTRTTPDAVFLINKASEMFLEKFTEDAYASSVQERKKFITYKHLSSTVYSGKRYEFLLDFVPEKVRAEDALKAKALVET